MYCIYTDKDVPTEKCNLDHVVPLSLGGQDEFVVWSDRDVNSKLGSEVDGKLGQDNLVRMALRDAGVKGHSGKESIPVWKNSQINGRPTQITWAKDKVVAWDAIDRRELSDDEFIGQEMSTTWQIDLHLTTRFLAKVALGAGYFIYGDIFRSIVDCETLRELSLLSREEVKNSYRLMSSSISICDRFHEDSQPNKPGYLHRVMAETIRRSMVVSTPHDDAISIHVGLVGMYIGSIIIPAETNDLPRYDEHDLGHALLLAPGPFQRISYRSLMAKVYRQRTGKEAPSLPAG
ncbi:HNH endonuclease [Agrobacterium tumefaciens]|nr:HNH endonuclease [Agrobacterium tumefaciens]